MIETDGSFELDLIDSLDCYKEIPDGNVATQDMKFFNKFLANKYGSDNVKKVRNELFVNFTKEQERRKLIYSEEIDGMTFVSYRMINMNDIISMFSFLNEVMEGEEKLRPDQPFRYIFSRGYDYVISKIEDENNNRHNFFTAFLENDKLFFEITNARNKNVSEIAFGTRNIDLIDAITIGTHVTFKIFDQEKEIVQIIIEKS